MADLITISDYKAMTGLSGTAQDTQITALITVVSTSIRRYCQRDETNGFESTARTERYNGSGESPLQLAEWPVTSVSSVTIYDIAGGTEVVPSTDYRIQGKTGLLYRLGTERGRLASARSVWYQLGPTMYDKSWKANPAWDEGDQNISVVYTGGYASIPDDLQYAAARMVDIALATAGTDPAKISESIGDYQYSLSPSAMRRNQEIATLLGPFTTGNA